MGKIPYSQEVSTSELAHIVYECTLGSDGAGGGNGAQISFSSWKTDKECTGL